VEWLYRNQRPGALAGSFMGGAVIAVGSPEDVKANPVVVKAYLGEAA